MNASRAKTPRLPLLGPRSGQRQPCPSVSYRTRALFSLLRPGFRTLSAEPNTSSFCLGRDCSQQQKQHKL